jgi:hypothetical protein
VIIEPDTPLRLAVAAKEAFPNGGMTASGLRKEAERGRLVIERIAGKDYTTLAAIVEMRKLCRVAPKVRASTYSPPAADATAASNRLSGASVTDRSSEARARMLATLQQPKLSSGTTLSKKARRASVTAIRPKP